VIHARHLVLRVHSGNFFDARLEAIELFHDGLTLFVAKTKPPIVSDPKRRCRGENLFSVGRIRIGDRAPNRANTDSVLSDRIYEGRQILCHFRRINMASAGHDGNVQSGVTHFNYSFGHLVGSPQPLEVPRIRVDCKRMR
jgi:hypothetical protein